MLRGKITLYATGSVAVLDDLRYANDPGLGTCADILGIISGHDVTVADNALNTPQYTNGNSQMRILDETKDLYIHAIFMALNTSFGVENYGGGPSDFSDCEGLEQRSRVSLPDWRHHPGLARGGRPARRPRLHQAVQL